MILIYFFNIPIKKVNLEIEKLKLKLRERNKFLEEEKKRVKQTAQIAKQAMKNLGNETKQHTVTAIVAAFGFIIALVWKDAIKGYVNLVIVKFSISGASYVITLYTAIVTTIIAVIGIVIITRWPPKDSKK